MHEKILIINGIKLSFISQKYELCSLINNKILTQRTQSTYYKINRNSKLNHFLPHLPAPENDPSIKNGGRKRLVF